MERLTSMKTIGSNKTMLTPADMSEKSLCNVANEVTVRPKYLWCLMLAYTIALFSANWLDPRHIKIFGLSTGAGSITFPLTYLLAGNITEVYGYKNTRLAIWTGLLFYTLFLIYGKFVIHFVHPYALNKHSLELFLNINSHIILGMFGNYLITESLNSYLVARLKKHFQGKYMGIRFLIATMAAYVLDEIIYAPIAFHNVMSAKNILHHMFDSWVFMVCLALLLLPLSIRTAKFLKKAEHMDIYDTHTNFNPLLLNTDYEQTDNKFDKKDSST